MSYFSKWRQAALVTLAAMTVSFAANAGESAELLRLRQLEKENAELKKALAEKKTSSAKTAVAEDKIAGDGIWKKVDGFVDVQAVWFGGEESRASKFQEYNDFDEALQLKRLTVGNVRAPGDKHYFKFDISDATQDDQRMDLEFGKLGAYDFGMYWNRIPHRFGMNGSTIFSGLGSDRLTISDAVRADLNATAANSVARANLLDDLAASSTKFDDVEDVSLERDQIGFDLKVYLFDPIRLHTAFDYEQREGVRVFAASIADDWEMLEPINYDTYNFDIGISYAANGFDADLSYKYSKFEDEYESVTWDNIYGGAADTAAVPITGRMALPADNDMHQVLFKAGYNFNEKVRLHGDASWSWRNSDVDLIPFTSNTALTTTSGANASLLSTLPDQDFDGDVFVSVYNLALDVSPVDWFDAKLYAKYEDLDDRREDWFSPEGWGRLDSSWDTTHAPAKVHHHDFGERTYGLDTTFRVRQLRTKIEPNYKYTTTDRQRRDSEDVHEHTVSVEAETNWTSIFDSKLGFKRAWQSSEYTGHPHDDWPFRKQYDISDRELDEWWLGFTVRPTKLIEGGIDYRHTDEDYDEGRIGLIERQLDVITMNTALTLSRVRLNTFYAWNQVETLQRGHSWNPGEDAGATDTAHPGDWTGDFESDYHTVGLGLNWQILPSKLTLTSNYTFAWNHTNIDLDSVIDAAGGAADRNAFEPQDQDDAEDSIRHSLEARLTYDLSTKAKVYVGYQLDYWDSSNMSLEGLTNVIRNRNGTLDMYNMNNIYEDATIHAAYVGFSLTF